MVANTNVWSALAYFLPQYLNFQYLIFLATYRQNFLSKDYLLSIYLYRHLSRHPSILNTYYNDLVNIWGLRRVNLEHKKNKRVTLILVTRYHTTKGVVECPFRWSQLYCSLLIRVWRLLSWSSPTGQSALQSRRGRGDTLPLPLTTYQDYSLSLTLYPFSMVHSLMACHQHHGWQTCSCKH